MRSFTVILLMLTLSSTTFEASTNDHQTQKLSEEKCKKLWFIEDDNKSCSCGYDVHGAVLCDNSTGEVSILDCYCMTKESHTNQTVVGACVYNCMNLSCNATYKDLFYHPVPSWCKGLHRAGTLCGRCSHEDHYYPPAYSYDLDCIKCPVPQSALVYIAEAFIPLTLSVALILAFRISAVHPALHSFVCVSQLLGAPVLARLFVFSTKYTGGILSIITNILLAFYGVWNLDFFRTLLPGVCLHLSTVEVLALDYLIAIYPIALMVIIYVLTELHAHGFKPVLLIWKPFHKLVVRFRRRWDVQTSLVDAFGTFFILSATKLFSVSSDLLTPTNLYLINGEWLGLYLYYDPNFKYMSPSSGHIYYGILAITVLLILIILPLSLLCCKCLSIRCRSRVIKDLLYTFQKYYKDGSEGTRDCRWYATFHHVNALIFYIFLGVFLGEITSYLLIIYNIVAAMIVVIVEPYKKEYSSYNILDSVLCLWCALFGTTFVQLNIASNAAKDFVTLSYVLLTTAGVTPPFIFFCMLVWWLLRVMGCKKCIRSEEDGEGTLAHRITHEQEYKDSCGYVALRNTDICFEKDSETFYS